MIQNFEFHKHNHGSSCAVAQQLQQLKDRSSVPVRPQSSEITPRSEISHIKSKRALIIGRSNGLNQDNCQDDMTRAARSPELMHSWKELGKLGEENRVAVLIGSVGNGFLVSRPGPSQQSYRVCSTTWTQKNALLTPIGGESDSSEKHHHHPFVDWQLLCLHLLRQDHW